MALDYEVDSIPEGFEDHYIEKDGKFVLDVKGIKNDSSSEDVEKYKSELEQMKEKLNEFRNTNIKLMKQIENSGAKVDEGFNVDIESAINEAIGPIKERNEELLKQNEMLQATLEEVVLSDRVKDIAIKHGVVESALFDVVSRAKQVFTVKDGKPVPKDRKNSRDADGNILDPEKWIERLSEEAPHLFKPSNGSGAVRPTSGFVHAPKTSVQKIADGLKKL